MTIVQFIAVLFEGLWILACTSVHTLKPMLVIFTCRCFTNFFTRYKFDSLRWLILELLRQFFQNQIVDLTFLQTFFEVWIWDFQGCVLFWNFRTVCIRRSVGAVSTGIELYLWILLHFQLLFFPLFIGTRLIDWLKWSSRWSYWAQNVLSLDFFLFDFLRILDYRFD